MQPNVDTQTLVNTENLIHEIDSALARTNLSLEKFYELGASGKLRDPYLRHLYALDTAEDDEYDT